MESSNKKCGEIMNEINLFPLSSTLGPNTVLTENSQDKNSVSGKREFARFFILRLLKSVAASFLLNVLHGSWEQIRKRSLYGDV